MSLAKFLNQQGLGITHEGVPLGWYPALSDSLGTIRNLFERQGDIIGDIGFYWINYINLILREYPGAKAINIWRNDDEVIESFWSYLVDEPAFEWNGYPFDSIHHTKDAIALTIKRYRYLENEVSKLYHGCIFTMNMEELNDEEALNNLVDWIGIKANDLNSVRANSRELILNASRKGRPYGRLSEKLWHQKGFSTE